MIRVLLADDHPVVREGLRGMLAAEQDIEVVADVPTPRTIGSIESAGRADFAARNTQIPVAGAGAPFNSQIRPRVARRR